MLITKSRYTGEEPRYSIRSVYVGNNPSFTGGVTHDIQTMIRGDKLHVREVESGVEESYGSLEEFYRNWRVHYLVTESNSATTKPAETVDENEFDKVIYDSLDKRQNNRMENEEK